MPRVEVDDHVAAPRAVESLNVPNGANGPAAAPGGGAPADAMMASGFVSPMDVKQLSGNIVNPYIHLYRGELGKMTVYRIRLDTSGNWAVSTTSIMTVLAIGEEQVRPLTTCLTTCLPA